MPKSRKNQEKRTKNVPIHQEQNHYELHIGHHEDPEAPFHSQDESPASKSTSSDSTSPSAKRASLTVKKNTENEEVPQKSGFGTRIWNFLEWIAMSALVFMVLFFFMNFGSYSQLIQTKWAKVTGSFELNPFLQQMVGGTQENTSQELLPVAEENAKIMQQIPPVKLDVAPPDDRVIIPRINQNVPVIGVSTENLLRRDWGALENDIQEALKYGVVHYPGTAQPGDRGNVVITGHSSYFPWDPGRFKDVFALLHEVVVGDEIIVYHEQQKYLYKVEEKKVVTPDQIDVLTQEGDNKLTLITCTPIGTNLKRLIITARPIQG